MSTPQQIWCVGYKWTVGDATRYAHTVVTAASQAAAESWLQQRYKHCTVLPLEQWRAERDRALAATHQHAA